MTEFTMSDIIFVITIWSVVWNFSSNNPIQVVSVVGFSWNFWLFFFVCSLNLLAHRQTNTFSAMLFSLFLLPCIFSNTITHWNMFIQTYFCLFFWCYHKNKSTNIAHPKFACRFHDNSMKICMFALCLYIHGFSALHYISYVVYIYHIWCVHEYIYALAHAWMKIVMYLQHCWCIANSKNVLEMARNSKNEFWWLKWTQYVLTISMSHNKI